MTRIAMAVMLALVAIELVVIAVLCAALVFVGTGQTIAVGLGMVVVALVACVVAWRTSRRA